MDEYLATHGFQKPKKRRVERELRERDPKIIENPKKSLVLYGHATSQLIKNVLSDFHILKKPYSIKFTKNNDIKPFEEASSLEFFSKKNDTSLFAMGNHTKKRPHNLIIGRFFNYQLLDMIEFGVDNYRPMEKSSIHANAIGSKPCIIFEGDFANLPNMRMVQNLFLDFFRGEQATRINLLGLDHAIVCTCISENLIHFAHYAIILKNKGSVAPEVELVHIGPSMNLTLRRTKFASDELRKQAERVPQDLLPSKKRNKNITVDELGNREGQLHIRQENIQNIALHKPKALDKKLDEKLREELDKEEARQLLLKRKREEMEQMEKAKEVEPLIQPKLKLSKETKFGKRRQNRYKRRRKK